MAKTVQSLKEMTIVRVFDAPREQVWKAWTEPEQFMRWWGPKDFTSPAAKIDFRVGGHYLACMRSPESKDFWSTGVYREIVPQKRIVVTDSFSDEDGNVVPASYYGMKGEFPLEMTVTMDFEDMGGNTRMTLRHAGFSDGPIMEDTKNGWNQSFDKLDRLLKGGKPGAPETKTEFIVDREKLQVAIKTVFGFSREKLWKAMTDPSLVSQWWGPGVYTTKVEKMEVRPGGKWRYVQHDPLGKEYAFSGVYQEAKQPEKLVYTFEYEAMPGHISIETVTLDELPDGRTLATDTVRFENIQDLEGMYKAGMETGATESMKRLTELLTRI